LVRCAAQRHAKPFPGLQNFDACPEDLYGITTSHPLILHVSGKLNIIDQAHIVGR
jgi:hypothetical protein